MYPRGSLRNILDNKEAHTGAEKMIADASPIGILVKEYSEHEKPTKPHMHRSNTVVLWCC